MILQLLRLHKFLPFFLLLFLIILPLSSASASSFSGSNGGGGHIVASPALVVSPFSDSDNDVQRDQVQVPPPRRPQPAYLPLLPPTTSTSAEPPVSEEEVHHEDIGEKSGEQTSVRILYRDPEILTKIFCRNHHKKVVRTTFYRNGIRWLAKNRNFEEFENQKTNFWCQKMIENQRHPWYTFQKGPFSQTNLYGRGKE